MPLNGAITTKMGNHVVQDLKVWGKTEVIADKLSITEAGARITCDFISGLLLKLIAQLDWLCCCLTLSSALKSL